MKLVTPEEQLKARWNQPYATRVEALKQCQDTTHLHPNALKELQQSEADSKNGPEKKDE
jgi:hypothetical protein